MWIVWFPKDRIPFPRPFYMSGHIRTHTMLQALASWLTARNWHNTVFAHHERVTYRGRVYEREQGRLLYAKVIDLDDWNGIEWKRQ